MIRFNCSHSTMALLSILLFSCSNCYAEERIVSISIQPELQTNNRVIVKGETNLPADTSLMIGLKDAVTGESRGQTKTKVLSDGTQLFLWVVVPIKLSASQPKSGPYTRCNSARFSPSAAWSPAWLNSMYSMTSQEIDPCVP